MCVCWKRPKIEIGGVLPKAPERRGQDNPIFHKNNYYSIIFIYIYIFFFDNLYYIIIFIYLPVVCCIFFIFLLMFLFLTYKVWTLE